MQLRWAILQFISCLFRTFHLINSVFIESRSLKLLSYFKCQRFVLWAFPFSIRNALSPPSNLLFSIVCRFMNLKASRKAPEEKQRQKYLRNVFFIYKKNNKRENFLTMPMRKHKAAESGRNRDISQESWPESWINFFSFVFHRCHKNIFFSLRTEVEEHYNMLLFDAIKPWFETHPSVLHLLILSGDKQYEILIELCHLRRKEDLSRNSWR